MKKNILTFALCAAAAMSLVGCGDKKVEVETPTTEVVEESTVESTEESTEEVVEEVKVFETAVDVLTAAHGQFDEEMMGYLGGGFGDYQTMNAPGVFPLEDTESLRAMLTFPVESVGMVDEAASLMHMMNANTYTSAAFHVGSEDGVLLVQEAILDEVKNNQWMCGFPEKLVIGSAGDYVLYAYGKADLVTMFETGITEVDGASVNFIEDLVALEEEKFNEFLAEQGEEGAIVDPEPNETIAEGEAIYNPDAEPAVDENTVVETETVEETTETIEETTAAN